MPQSLSAAQVKHLEQHCTLLLVGVLAARPVATTAALLGWAGGMHSGLTRPNALIFGGLVCNLRYRQEDRDGENLPS